MHTVRPRVSGDVADVGGRRQRSVFTALNLAVAFMGVSAVLAAAWIDDSWRHRLLRIDAYLTAGLYVALVIMVLLARVVRRRATWNLPSGAAVPAALGASVLVFGIPVFAAWSGAEWWAMIGGAVPWSDAQLYLGGAERLLFLGDLDVFNSRRPLNAMFLAVRLAMTGLDVRAAIVLQAVLVGGACYVAARAVSRDLGRLAGFALFVGLVGYSRVYVPATMSESLGVALGALAFAVAWHAVRDRSRRLAVGAAFLLISSLNARAGVVLMALLVPLWLARYLRKTSQLLDWKVLAASAAAVVAGLALNYAAVAGLGGNVDNAFGNGGYLLYGMAQGLPSWDVATASLVQVYFDHPEIVAMTETERTRFVNTEARKAVLAHPVRFTIAALKSEKNYLVNAKRDILWPFPISAHRPLMAAGALAIIAAFLTRIRRGGRRRAALDLALFGCMLFAVPALVSRVPGGQPPPWLGLGLVVAAFVAFLVIGTGRMVSEGHLSLTLVAFVAIVLCLPAIGVDTVRVFAASAAFMALPLALAAAVLARSHPPDPVALGGRSYGTVPLTAGVAIVAGLFVGTPIAMAAIDLPALPARVCPDGRPAEPIVGGVGVRVVAPGQARKARDQVDAEEFQAQLHPFFPIPYVHFQNVPAPFSVIGGLTPTGVDRLAILEGDVVAPRGSARALCGEAQHDPLTELIFSYFPQPLDVFKGRAAANAPGTIAPSSSQP